jgi:hypothetical protein
MAGNSCSGSLLPTKKSQPKQLTLFWGCKGINLRWKGKTEHFSGRNGLHKSAYNVNCSGRGIQELCQDTLNMIQWSLCKSQQLFFLAKNVATWEMETFESTWHVLVNFTITAGYMYSSVYAYHMQTSLCWWPRSETEVHKIPSSYMIMLQPTWQTLLKTSSSIGSGKCYNPLLILPTLCLPPTSGSCIYTPIWW